MASIWFCVLLHTDPSAAWPSCTSGCFQSVLSFCVVCWTHHPYHTAASSAAQCWRCSCCARLALPGHHHLSQFLAASPAASPESDCPSRCFASVAAACVAYTLATGTAFLIVVLRIPSLLKQGCALQQSFKLLSFKLLAFSF